MVVMLPLNLNRKSYFLDKLGSNKMDTVSKCNLFENGELIGHNTDIGGFQTIIIKL